MCLPADLRSSAWDVTNSRKAADTRGTRATEPTRVGAGVVAATRNQLTQLRLSDSDWCTATEHDAFGHGRTGNGAAKSSGLIFWIRGDELYDRTERLGWSQLSVCE